MFGTADHERVSVWDLFGEIFVQDDEKITVLRHHLPLRLDVFTVRHVTTPADNSANTNVIHNAPTKRVKI
jgi:hypothetical protein